MGQVKKRNSEVTKLLKDSQEKLQQVRDFNAFESKVMVKVSHLRRAVRKPVFAYAKTNADQLHGDREADQRLCFSYTDSTVPILPKSKISSL